ncbi:MAG: CheR family methyltransferase, partial [Pseudomonadota bacterium]
PDLLPKYFDIKDDSICVKAKLRSFVMFSRHNVFQDPPFISDDLISIRNVLIYFSTKLQERVLTRMVYALNPGGHLLLGTSETLGHMESQFSQVSPESRLYRLDSNKIALRDREAAYIGQSPTLVPRGEAGKSSQAASVDEWKRFDRLAQSVAPISLLMNRERMVLRIYGDVGPYCSITSQSFGNSNISILKKPLASDAASLALVALKHDERRQGQWHQVPGGDGKVVQLTAYPMQADADLNADIVLIGFETKDEPEPATTEQEKTDYVHYLEDELARTRDALQVTIEQLQTSNEELQAVNEELQSSNEELQSTNEELETSNEELQSTNEELITVNEELLVNTSQLERTSAELGAIVQNTPTMLLMIDQGLLIRYASERAKQVFSLGERGTGYGHLSQAMIPHGYPRIVDMCSQVLTSREPMTHRFQTGLRLNELAIAPISGLDGQMIGLVLQIQSVDSEDGLSLLSERLREIAEIGTWRYNTATNKVSISRHLAEIIGTEVETLESSFDKILEFCRDEDRDRVQKILNDATEKLEKFDYFVSMNRPDGTSFLGRNIGEAFRDHETGNIILAGNFRNISDELNKNFLIKHYERVFGEHGIGFYSYDVRHNLPFWSPTFFDILGYDRDTVPSMELGLDVFSGEARKRVESSVQQAMQMGAPFDYTEEMTRKNGSRASVRGLGDVAKDETGAVTHVFGSFQVLEELP